MNIVGKYGPGMGVSASYTSSSYRYENEKMLLKIIKEQFGITDEDMESQSEVKRKIRDSNLDNILEYKI